MPRIDPERLLKCLQPLLEPTSGAIRSTDEVDKILGLMSKFSKKLVSKCIYINILKASHPSVVDLFMERGGWNLIFGWTNDAIANKNYPLLKEVFQLLLCAPVTVSRLKSNRFPVLIKNYSKDCEDEETKNICRQVVSRWITIAKSEEKTDSSAQHQQSHPQPPQTQQQPILGPAPPPVQLQEEHQQQQPSPVLTNHSISSSATTVVVVDPNATISTSANSTVEDLPNLGTMNADHLLNIDPASISMLPDTDGAHQSLMDLDLTHSELAGLDINLDILNELDLGKSGLTFDESLISGSGPPQQNHHEVIQTTTTHQQQTATPISVIQHASAPMQPQQQQPQYQQIIQQQQPHQIILEQQHPITVPIRHQVIQQPQLQQQPHQQIQLIAPQTTSGVILTSVNSLSAVNSSPVVSTTLTQQPQHFQFIQQAPQIVQAPPLNQSEPQPQQMLLVKQPNSTQPIILKTGPQRNNTQSFAATDLPPSQYCLVVRDGKSYLMKLKTEQSSTPANLNQVHVVQQQQPQQEAEANPPKVPPLVISTVQSKDATDGSPTTKKVKTPRKEPHIVSPMNKVPGDIQKTYSKTKAGSTTSSTTSTSSSGSSGSSKDGSSKDKKSGENVKPRDKDHHDHHHKDKDKKSKSSSSSSDHHRKSKKESEAKKAAQAAADAKEEERLREKIRREKAQMKKRQKEQAKMKEQTEKDQETLKKLNLLPPSSGSSTSGTSSTGSSSSGSSMKIPKIPKRSNSSFADAIGIPGSDGSSSADKIKKVSPEKGKDKGDKEEMGSPEKRKFYGKKEEEAKAEEDKPKERKNRPKVFVSSKSRSDDLLKEMTEGGSKKQNKDKEKEEKEKEPKSSIISNLGNSIPATPPKSLSKRLSTDALEKPGDPKKAKLDSKEKDSKKKEEEKAKEKEKQRKAAAVKLKESSLFMDALSAAESVSETRTVKKKRRTSSGGDGKDAPKSGEIGYGNDVLVDEVTTPTEVKKPVFNFYRDTLNDEDEEEERKEDKGEEERGDASDETPSSGSFTPQEGDGKVKSALVLVRSRNRPKKSVKWRDEDELREFHYFEMDETERINVTKQKGFTDLSRDEKEGEHLKKGFEDEEREKNKPWKLIKILFTSDVLQPTIISTEKAEQEEREKNVLGLFLPPGSILPDSGTEPDVPAPPLDQRPEPKQIPVEDVNSITKVCDYRTHSWPDPKGGPAMFPSRQAFGGSFGMDIGPSSSLMSVPPPVQRPGGHGPNFMQPPPQFPPQMVPNPQVSPQQQDYNPWSATGAGLGFNVPPPTAVPPPSTGDLSGFNQFPGPAAAALGLNILGNQGLPVVPPAGIGFGTPNPFSFPPPPTAMMNGLPPQQPQQQQTGVIMDYGPGTGRGGSRGPSRFDNNDRRSNFRDSGRDRDRGGSRDRDYRGSDDRGSRDRDYRRGGSSSSSDRDYRSNDRDSRSNSSRDYRSGGASSSSSSSSSSGGRNIRKEIPCRFFKKGFCTNGSRCEFLHEDPSHGDSSSSSSRRRSPPSDRDSRSHQNSNHDEEDWEASSGSNHIPDSAQSPPQEEQQQAPNHQPRLTSRFSDAPMSPTDDSPMSPVGNFGAGENTKVIPV